MDDCSSQQIASTCHNDESDSVCAAVEIKNENEGLEGLFYMKGILHFVKTHTEIFELCVA